VKRVFRFLRKKGNNEYKKKEEASAWRDKPRKPAKEQKSPDEESV